MSFSDETEYKGTISVNIEDLENKKPASKEGEIAFKGVTVGVTYGFNIWLTGGYGGKPSFSHLSDDIFIDFTVGPFNSENLEKRLGDMLYWKEYKIGVFKKMSPSNWGLYWSGVTGGVDRIDKILFSDLYLSKTPLIHFELEPVEIDQPFYLKDYDQKQNGWLRTGNYFKGSIRRLLTIYRSGFLTITYFLILSSLKRDWLDPIPHLTLKNNLTVDELIFILTKKMSNFVLRSGVKVDLDRLVIRDFQKILGRIYDVADSESKRITEYLVDRSTSNYYSVCIWDIDCRCQREHVNALDVIRNHPWEIYGLRGPDKDWRNRRSSYIINSISEWFNPYSDIVFKPFPRVHIEITFPLVRRKSLIAMGPFSPPQRLWEFRVIQEKVFRTFNQILGEENSKLSRKLMVEELIETVKNVTNVRRRILSVLEDIYWLPNSLLHIPDRYYMNYAQRVSGLIGMKNNMFEKINHLVEISRDEANIANLDVGSRMSLIRTYASVLSIFLATIITLAGSLSSFYIWVLGPRPPVLTIVDQVLIVLQIFGLNAIFIIPVILVIWRIFKKFR